MRPEITLTDPLTGEAFVPQRSNQIYKSRKTQVIFNNQKASTIRKEKKSVDRSLYLNFIIVRELMRNKKEETFPKDYLHGKGLNYDCFTGYLKFEGKYRHCIYNYIIVPDEVNNNLIKIIKNG